MEKKQGKALQLAYKFIETTDLSNPNLTTTIWKIINGKNKQQIIDSNKSKEFSENWSQDNVGELQRILVNYQLMHMKIGNSPPIFETIKHIFSQVEKDSSILDIGCTSGYYYEILNFYFPDEFKYHGCDYNESSVKLAKKYYPKVQFTKEDITKLSFDKNSYDICFISGVFEHVPLYEQAISDVCRVSNKYIILHRIFLTDKKTFCKKGSQYFVSVIRNTYNKKTFFKLFEKHGFKLKWESNVFDKNCKSYILIKNL